MNDLDYFHYLSARNPVKKLLRRRLYLRPVAREIEGRLLDVGCGIGEMLEMHRDSVGIDINKYCVEYCRKRGLDAEAGDIYRIQCSGEKFDTVLCSNVLEHLSDPNAAIEEMKRVLKLNGRLIIVVPTFNAYKKDPTHKVFIDADCLSFMFARHRIKFVRSFYLPVNDEEKADRLPINGELVMVGESV